MWTQQFICSVGAISATWISSMMNDDGAGDDGIYIDMITKSIETLKADKLHWNMMMVMLQYCTPRVMTKLGEPVKKIDRGIQEYWWNEVSMEIQILLHLSFPIHRYVHTHAISFPGAMLFVVFIEGNTCSN